MRTRLPATPHLTTVGPSCARAEAPTRRPLVAPAALVALILLPASASPAIEEPIAVGPFVVTTTEAGLSSLRIAGDRFGTEHIATGRVLGDVVLHYRWHEPDARWKQARTDRTEVAQPLPRAVRRGTPREGESFHEAVYTTHADGGAALELTSGFAVIDGALGWRVGVRNLSTRAIEVGDVALPLHMNTRGGETPEAIYEQTLVKHHFVGGDGSFLYWVRPNGVGPLLVMTPERGTRLEFHQLTDQVRDVRQDFYVYIHSGAKGPMERRGTWRQPHTSLVLSPSGQPGDEARFGFVFETAPDIEGVRDALYARGLPDIYVVPGLTVPTDLDARVAVRSRVPIAALEAEHPGQTRVERLGPSQGLADTVIYRLDFNRLGENWVDVRDADGRTTRVEFFVTEPVETLVKKRARFLVASQQHRRPDRWYDGLFSIWDMRSGVLRGPDDTDGYDGWWGYVLAADDPGLSKAPFLAAKNRHFPDRDEIAAIEYYLERFVWGGLQRTDAEHPYPYGIYGVPNWHELRTSPWGFDSSGKGLEHVFRMFDYPHVVMLYFHMYEIAKQYPGLTTYLDAAGYLERATETARAYFTYPYALRPFYEIYKWGCYNELVLLDLIEALEAEGRRDAAAWLRAEWEKKVTYFVYDDPYPFRSEYSFDTTGFESTHAIARYAMAHELTPVERSWYDTRLDKWWSHTELPRERIGEFMERQIKANLAVRGVIEPAYYFLGSDYRRESSRYTLSYMAQMGGWALVDYALHVAAEPGAFLRVGYASYLSAWAMVNSGTAASNYGYWYPGPQNDGAAAWGFSAEKFGSTWIRKDVGRGAWPYDGEIDLGFGGALRTSATIVADDAIFGRVAYGGTLVDAGVGGVVRVVPRDGLRQRLHLLTRDGKRRHVWLDWDGFAPGEVVEIGADGSRLAFVLENRSGLSHQARLRLAGLAPGTYELRQDGRAVASATAGEDGRLRFSWPVDGERASIVVERRP